MKKRVVRKLAKKALLHYRKHGTETPILKKERKGLVKLLMKNKYISDKLFTDFWAEFDRQHEEERAGEIIK